MQAFCKRSKWKTLLYSKWRCPLAVHRLSSDGDLVELRQAGNTEGKISVLGSTVSYEVSGLHESSGIAYRYTHRNSGINYR